MLWTSEAVSEGHPDKVADQISDAVLDAHLAVDPMARVACEVAICGDLVLVMGEITCAEEVAVEPIVRKTLCDIGYDGEESGYDGNTIEIVNKLHKQSGEISGAVTKEDGVLGAGDQGMMFGFACDEVGSPIFMPMTHHLAFEIIGALKTDRGREESILQPDAKSQVTVRYEDGVPVHIDTVVVSTCHKPLVTMGDLQGYMRNILKECESLNGCGLFDEKTKLIINPAGLWTLGGPAADSGLTGRKLVVDNYGSDCPIGGGAFSGKDPTKVDRSAAYMARFLAKNLVVALGGRVQVQLAYAIGIVQPVSVRVIVNGEDRDANDMFKDIDLSPKGIIDRLDLRRPIYQATASGGHFGRKEFPWEEIEEVNQELWGQ
jgi:S-adenosylmethionine synthetase